MQRYNYQLITESSSSLLTIKPKREIFDIVGKTINQDLSTFHNDLAATKAAANSDMRSTLAIFEQMHAKQQEINRK